MAQFRKDTHQYLPQETTIFEVVMLSDQYGNLVGPANPSGTAVDAFGRARVSTPLTLFDSSHRYRDNGLWSKSNTNNTTITFSSNEGVINLAVSTANSDEIIRETSKVFSYQPGKSLQILNTFVFAPAQTNLRQRVGYYGANNGIYLELANNSLYWVERSYSTGSLVETRVEQSQWNIDTLLGNVTSSPSQRTLDISKAQIQFIDIEWLGLGTVRCGFIIDGQLIHCHSFHHANKISSTYMTTASLPVRYEIKNTGPTSNSSILKQVCSSVITEGGYELRGSQQSIGSSITSPYSLATKGTFYPIVSIRLKSDKLDAIVILTALSILGTGNGPYFEWRVVQDADITTASWTSADANSAVEYTTTGTAMTGGKVMAQGYTVSSTQGAGPVDILKEALFKFQLERDGLSSNAKTLTLAVSSDTDTTKVYGSMDWEEISR